MEGGALAPLVTVGNAADLETQRCIAYALCNLSVDEARRPTIVDEGGLPPIISLACSEEAADVKAAVSTLRGLSSSPKARQIIVAGSRSSWLAARNEDVWVRRKLLPLEFVITNDLNKVDMATSDASRS